MKCTLIRGIYARLGEGYHICGFLIPPSVLVGIWITSFFVFTLSLIFYILFGGRTSGLNLVVLCTGWLFLMASFIIFLLYKEPNANRSRTTPGHETIDPWQSPHQASLTPDSPPPYVEDKPPVYEDALKQQNELAKSKGAPLFPPTYSQISIVTDQYKQMHGKPPLHYTYSEPILHLDGVINVSASEAQIEIPESLFDVYSLPDILEEDYTLTSTSGRRRFESLDSDEGLHMRATSNKEIKSTASEDAEEKESKSIAQENHASDAITNSNSYNRSLRRRSRTNSVSEFFPSGLETSTSSLGEASSYSSCIESLSSVSTEKRSPGSPQQTNRSTLRSSRRSRSVSLCSNHRVEDSEVIYEATDL